MTNPVIARLTRGGIIESMHRGAYAVVDTAGTLVATEGDVDRNVFPRSAIKAFQCLPVIESGAADHFGLTDAEIALCCASHNGEPEHVQAAQSILSKNGCGEGAYECGAHYPTASAARDDLVRNGEKPRQIHNNCSGKHAGMLTLARHLGAEPRGYIQLDHPVQRAIKSAMSEICSTDLDNAPIGVDGCSVPTWAFPLRKMALGFARLCERPAGQKIIAAVRANPFLVGGSKSFDTELMQQFPRIFVKGGAEGVYCGCIPHAKIGFALKCDDGASRASEVAIAGVMLKLECWTDEERSTLEKFAHEDLRNWNRLQVGERISSIE